MVVLTAGALWLCDFYTGMRVHPSFARKGAVWSEDERVAAGPRTILAAAFAPRTQWPFSTTYGGCFLGSKTSES